MRAIIAEGFFLALFPSLAAAAVVFGIVTWFLQKRIDTKLKMRSLPFDVPAGLFLIISTISVFASPARNFELIYQFFALVGIYFLTYILIGQNIRSREQVKQLVKALAFSALLVVLWGYFQYIFGIDTADMKWVDPEKFPELKNRVFSTLENPNVLAGYLDVCICLALGMLAKVSSRSQKIVMVIAILMLLACLAMTYARGAFITIVIVFIVYGIIQDWRILILFIIAIAGLLIYDDALVHRLTSLFNLTDSSQGLRIGIWISTFAMIEDHPFIGIGWGAFKSLYPSYDYYLKGADVLIYHAHNIFLHYAAEVGIIGAMSFFWCFFGTMFMSLELGNNEKYQAIKETILYKISQITGIDFKGKIINFKNEVKQKYLIENGRLEKFIGIKEKVNEKMADASDHFVNWLSKADEVDGDEGDESKKVSLNKKISLKRKTPKKHRIKNHTVESDTTLASDTMIIATENNEEKIILDTNVEIKIENSTNDLKTEKTAKVIKFNDDVDDEIDKVDEDNEESKEEKTILKWDEVAAINNKQIAEGVKFGIGLAILSMALNGLTDDLLFNIPTSMLLWILTALSAAIEYLPEEEPTRRRKR